MLINCVKEYFTEYTYCACIPNRILQAKYCIKKYTVILFPTSHCIPIATKLSLRIFYFYVNR